MFLVPAAVKPEEGEVDWLVESGGNTSILNIFQVLTCGLRLESSPYLSTLEELSASLTLQGKKLRLRKEHSSAL